MDPTDYNQKEGGFTKERKEEAGNLNKVEEKKGR